MRFTCSGCGSWEYQVNITDMKHEQVSVRVVCPECGSIDEVSFSGYDTVVIELVKK